MNNPEDIQNINPFPSFMPFTKIMTGKYEILQTGIALLPQSYGNLMFDINGFEFNIKFLNDKDYKENNVKIEIQDDKHVNLLCYNWITDTPRSLANPVHVFSFGQIKIFLMFLVEGIDHIPRVTYTFYREEIK